MAPQIVPTVPLAVMRSAASSFSSSSSTSLEPLYTTTVIETVYASATAQSSSSPSKAGSIASAAAALAQGDIGEGGEVENGYLSFAEIGAIITSLFLTTLVVTVLASFVLAQARNARRLAEGRSTDLEWFGLGRSSPKEGDGRRSARPRGEAKGEQAGLMGAYAAPRFSLQSRLISFLSARPYR
ncbi:hypothetical protein BJY59DRAFT_235476 [Rhodotorula toruloides]